MTNSTAPVGQRRYTRDLVTIDQRWRRVTRGQPRLVGTVRQVHRADRTVDLQLPDGERLRVAFKELRKHWRRVGAVVPDESMEVA